MTMKSWKVIILIAGILLLIVAMAIYAARIASCYPSAAVWAQFAPEYVKGLRQSCQFDAIVVLQFGSFLAFFIPGILLFSTYWLSTRPRIKKRRSEGGSLSTFALLLMLDSLLVTLYGLLGYPEPGIVTAPAAWAVESIAALGFLCYLALLAVWHWKRWGVMLFQGASVALAVFILMGGGSLLLAAVIVGGVIVLSLLVRPLRSKFG
jgi:hypothetical protein